MSRLSTVRKSRRLTARYTIVYTFRTQVRGTPETQSPLSDNPAIGRAAEMRQVSSTLCGADDYGRRLQANCSHKSARSVGTRRNVTRICATARSTSRTLEVCLDGPTFIRRSDRRAKLAYMVFGYLDDVEVVVAFTIRSDVCWIISARRARRDERQKYHRSSPATLRAERAKLIGQTLRKLTDEEIEASIASDPDWQRRFGTGPKRSSSSPRKRRRFRSASTRTCSIISRKRAQAISGASTRCCARTCSRSAMKLA